MRWRSDQCYERKCEIQSGIDLCAAVIVFWRMEADDFSNAPNTKQSEQLQIQQDWGSE